MIRDLLDRADAMERALTAAGFDVTDLRVGSSDLLSGRQHRTLFIEIAGGQAELTQALTVLGMQQRSFIVSRHAASSFPALVHFEAGYYYDGGASLLSIAAERPMTPDEIAEAGEPRD